jgi:Mg2+/Co2+ transporter CorB
LVKHSKLKALSCTNGPLQNLEGIPQFNVCLKMGEYHLETLQIRDNFIKTVRLRRIQLSVDEVH